MNLLQIFYQTYLLISLQVGMEIQLCIINLEGKVCPGFHLPFPIGQDRAGADDEGGRGGALTPHQAPDGIMVTLQARLVVEGRKESDDLYRFTQALRFKSIHKFLNLFIGHLMLEKLNANETIIWR